MSEKESPELTYQERLDLLREKKLAQTEEKRQVIGAMDHDDWALILPPPDLRKTVQAISGSGVPITDVLIDGVEMESNHANGGFYGPAICGRNFRRLLDAHPPYIDPLCSIAGAAMANFSSYRTTGWNPDFDYSHLHDEQRKYSLVHGIGGSQHFCPDLAIGFKLGWSGLLDKIAYYRVENGPEAAPFYDGLEAIIFGIQDWIRRNADEARRLAGTGGESPASARAGKTGRHQRSSGHRAAGDLPRGLPVDDLVPDGGAHVQRQRRARPPGCVAPALLRGRHRRRSSDRR